MTAGGLQTLIAHGWERADRSRPDTTTDYFGALAQLFPGEPEVVYAYACALDFAGDEQAAAHAYEQCPWEELTEDDRTRGRIQYAATLRNLGRSDDALRAITPLRQHNPHDPAPVVYESLIQVDRGDVLQAIQLLLHHILQTTTDDKLRDYRWALRRYINALTLPPPRRSSLSRTFLRALSRPTGHRLAVQPSRRRPARLRGIAPNRNDAQFHDQHARNNTRNDAGIHD
ncbi:tetratricopeptide repeat protein [Mycobacterium sp. BMJ-28]